MSPLKEIRPATCAEKESLKWSCRPNHQKISPLRENVFQVLMAGETAVLVFEGYNSFGEAYRETTRLRPYLKNKHGICVKLQVSREEDFLTKLFVSIKT